ncbi:DUF1294 domain-containing protein [Teredinibacter turnerae]|uniref:DUF1294 domain-containing protein n=1 Tax=Teredinibacter turnerae TaxID=2426 RepID=UPI0005F86F4E|nr:DUF1294 domain-containing protein [Teredinibacter turnerae]
MKNYQPYVVIIFFLVISASYILGFTPLIIGVAFLSISCIAYAYYAKDKKAAKSGEWRVPESTLHMLGLLCGWPGALLAQYQFRHKTKKASFRLVFWIVVLINVAAFSWLHTPDGRKQLKVIALQAQNIAMEHANSEAVISTMLLLTEYHDHWLNLR